MKFVHKLCCLPFILALMFSFSACDKDKNNVEVTGCKDPESVNYNPDVTKDNGSCLYLADLYVGNYVVKDTISYTFNGQTDTYYNNYSFSIAKTGNKTIVMNNFNDCCNIDAMLSKSSIVPTNATNNGIASFIGTFDGTRIRYTYITGTAGPDQHHRGTAIKQP